MQTKTDDTTTPRNMRQSPSSKQSGDIDGAAKGRKDRSKLSRDEFGHGDRIRCECFTESQEELVGVGQGVTYM